MMNLSNITPHKRWYVLALVIFILDQVSKYWITANFDYGQPWVITSFFNFTLLHNTGAAFSFLSEAGGWQRWFFSVVAFVISIIVVVWLARLDKTETHEALALALVLGGALGNLCDRVVLGHVVDFIVVHYQSYYWPAFNIADSAICIGAGLLVLLSFKQDQTD